MARNTTGLVFIFLLALAAIVFVGGCITGNPLVIVTPALRPPLPVVTTPPVMAQSCMVDDDDRVPAGCCHPTSCINKTNKSVCNLLCTMNCEGLIDCGAGSCGCVNGKCSVVASAS